MNTMVQVEITSKVTLDLALLAKAFANLNDDDQTKFFALVAENFAESGPHVAEHQGIYIGKHMRGCECSTDGGRRFIEAIAEGLKP